MLKILSPLVVKRSAQVLVVGCTVGASWYCLAKNDYSLKNIGVARFAKAGWTASRIFLDYKLSLVGLASSTDAYQNKLKGCHQRGAERLLDLARSNGGVFIKVGQHIASLEYLLPTEYTSTLAVLHSKAPESDLDEIKAVFRNNLHKEISDVFTHFDPKPCGAASLAQVHEARLRSTGERVAVKIQHPKVKSRSYVDMATMEVLVRIASWLFPSLRLMWLVDETKRNLPKELDFLQEAANADRMRGMFSHLPYVIVPRIHHELSSDMVLTMDFEEGGQINDLDYFKRHKIDSHSVCAKLGRLYSEMIFVRGYVHCDPHPGNVLVRKNARSGEEEVVLLDHGLYLALPDQLRVDYSQLWLALMRADKEGIERICTKMGVGVYYGLFACIVTLRSWDAVTKGITKSKVDSAESSHIQHFATKLIPQISALFDLMPREMLLILKTNDLLRGISRRLGVENRAGSFIEMTRYCTRAVYGSSIEHSRSLVQKLLLYVQMYYLLTAIYLHEHWLMVVDSLVSSLERYRAQRETRIDKLRIV